MKSFKVKFRSNDFNDSLIKETKSYGANANEVRKRLISEGMNVVSVRLNA